MYTRVAVDGEKDAAERSGTESESERGEGDGMFGIDF